MLMASIYTTGAETGVCYGRNGDNLPSPSQVVNLYNQNNIKTMRTYDARHDVLDALSGSTIELMLGLANSDLQKIAQSQSEADSWVQDNVKNYNNVKFRYICVGNELKPGMTESQYLVPAMKTIQSSINGAGLGSQIKVSSAIEIGALQVSYPPSEGSFNQDYLDILTPLINFLNENGSPLFVNLYPYFSHADNPTDVPLDYSLFTSGVRFTDGTLQYTNVFDATLDAVYAALEKSNGGSLKVVISESGWPSAGGTDTSIENAKTYNNNLIQHVKGGTPKRPGALEAYVFAMFDENQKGGDEIEKHFGLFSPDQSAKYQTTFN
jgi:exo-beta-1,3-glucanase (GH17 family)